MDISKLTAEQLSAVASQFQELAEQKSRELNPELITQILDVVDGVVTAGNLLTEGNLKNCVMFQT